MNKQSHTKVVSNQGELAMLLIRPYLTNIFSSDITLSLDRFGTELDSMGVSVFYVMTKHGIQSIKRNNINWLHMFPILCISENGRVGYTFTMRLDLQIWLKEILKHSGFSISDFPKYFKDHDVIFVADGAYTNRLFYNDQNIALKIRSDGFTNELNIADIAYCATVNDDRVIANLRTIEDNAKSILFERKKDKERKQIEELPQLPFHLYSDLKPIFNRARESIKRDSQGK